MAGGLSRVWCTDTAPLCNQEGRAQWVPSPIHDLIFLDGSLVPAGLAAGTILDYCQGLDLLLNIPVHSLPDMDIVRGTDPGRTARLACR